MKITINCSNFVSVLHHAKIYDGSLYDNHAVWIP